MLKGSNIFGKIEFGLAILGMAFDVAFVVMLFYSVLVGQEINWEHVRNITRVSAIALIPYAVLSFLTYRHAMGSMRSGFAAGGFAILLIPVYLLITLQMYMGLTYQSLAIQLFLLGLPATIISAAIANEHFLSKVRILIPRRRS